MPEFKVVVADPRTGRAVQVELKGGEAQRLLGLKIGDEVPAEVVADKLRELGYEVPPGFRIRITGGSGIEGAPMVPFLDGPVKRYLLLSGPPGFHPRERGERRRKLVRGNTISEQIVQVNTVLVYPPNYSGEPIIKVGVKEREKQQKGGEGGEEAAAEA